MFEKQYQFKGRHANRVSQLTEPFDLDRKCKLFPRNVDIYIIAPLVGFLYGTMAELDSTKNPENNQVYSTNIFPEQIRDAADELTFHYQLIMLLDKSHEPDEKKRIDKTFRFIGEKSEDEERFHAYVRGGVDVLYEKLMTDNKEVGDYFSRMYEFLEEFQERFYGTITEEQLAKLCKRS